MLINCIYEYIAVFRAGYARNTNGRPPAVLPISSASRCSRAGILLSFSSLLFCCLHDLDLFPVTDSLEHDLPFVFRSYIFASPYSRPAPPILAFIAASVAYSPAGLLADRAPVLAFFQRCAADAADVLFRYFGSSYHAAIIPSSSIIDETCIG